MKNSPIFATDRATHIKILAVALVASIVVVIVGLTARPSQTNTTRHQINVPLKVAPPIVAAQPAATEIR